MMVEEVAAHSGSRHDQIELNYVLKKKAAQMPLPTDDAQVKLMLR